MQIKNILSLALASVAAAQTAAPPSLANALKAQGNLTSLVGLVNATGLLDTVLALKNVTIFAPSNAAIAAFTANNATAAAIAKDPGLVSAVLLYHIANGTYNASSIPTTGAFVPTYLTNSTYTNVTGGAVVNPIAKNGGVEVHSGLADVANVTTANLAFDGGIIHIIDKVLTLPQKDSTTAIAAGLSALAGALTNASLVSTVDNLKDVTIFAPSNAAFGAIANLAGSLNSTTLSSILTYHVLQGTVGYSTTLKNQTVKTVNGQQLNILVLNGTVFINSAKVILPDVLVGNGVVHVIDNVLNPANTTLQTDVPAFAGATSSSAIPFTTGVPTASQSAGAATTATTGGSSSSTGGMPRQTAAVGAAALFGGAAFLAANL